MPTRSGSVTRFVCFVSLMTFFPSALCVWNFVPSGIGAAQAETRVAAEPRITVDSDTSRLTVREHEFELPLPGLGSVAFDRVYVNEDGIEPSATDAGLGSGWTHSFVTAQKTNDKARLTYFYDNQDNDGKLTKVQARQGDGSKIVLSYDDTDHLTKVALVQGNTETATVAYAFDESGRLVEATRSSGETTKYKYENKSSRALLTTITDDGNRSICIDWSFGSNSAGTPTTSQIVVTQPDGKKVTHVRSADNESGASP